METVDQTSVGRYRPLGLVANPFLNHRNRDGESRPLAREIQSQANCLVAAVDAAAHAQRGSTIWVEKSDQVHMSYHSAAQVESERSFLGDEGLSVLHAYVPLFAAKVGRVRSVLNVLAERLATRSFDRTLSAWLAPLIDSPDTEIPEWANVQGEMWDEFVTAFKVDRLEAVASIFGPNVMFRALEASPPVDLRSSSLEEEPEETDSSPEDDENTAVIPEPIDFAALDSEDDEVIEAVDVLDIPDAVFEYIVALARKSLSPVVARGLRVYASRGAGPLAEELKITKAPRKTLRVLTELATSRFKRVVIIFDGYDNWNIMPRELRAKYVGALSEMRLLLGARAVMIFLVTTGEAPELDDMFGGGTRVSWDFPNIATIKDVGLELAVIQSWLADAAIPGSVTTLSAQELLEAFGVAADGDLPAFCERAAAAIEDLATRGAIELDDVSINAGMAAVQDS